MPKGQFPPTPYQPEELPKSGVSTEDEAKAKASKSVFNMCLYQHCQKGACKNDELQTQKCNACQKFVPATKRSKWGKFEDTFAACKEGTTTEKAPEGSSAR